ncbi:GDP-fucose protein O-fucosyltransferase [Carex littledalei]|uniref:O-fucosyltransferase family protein n=1 Tax=Carex littledalei TaxID=544730 RepID=A0A833RN18_9POAL|nr:GDP-fucose protein O-fucosyltransferase [Carex littledalei]
MLINCCCGGGGVDVRQVVGGLLTASMFLMIAITNIISSLPPPPPPPPPLMSAKVDHRVSITTGTGTAFAIPLRLAPCWRNPTSHKKMNESKGFITFSLTTGPEHHISQVTDAVVIARYLGATLVLPDIRGRQVGQRRNFGDIYDVDKLISALTGIVRVTKDLPADMATRQPAILRIKNRVSEYKIEKQIQPIFRRNNYLRLALIYQSASFESKQLYTNKELLATACVAMFQSLELQPELQKTGDKIIQRLRELGAKSNGEYVAVDLKSSCLLDGVAGRKRCYSASEVASFFKKAGFSEETVVYLTEAFWHESLNPLKDAFPKTYTKDDIIPAEKKDQFLIPGNEDLEKALDIHVCSKSDTFVAAVYGPSYSYISGRRIASGRSRILLVSDRWAQNSDFASPFVSKKSHVAHSCYC